MPPPFRILLLSAVTGSLSSGNTSNYEIVAGNAVGPIVVNAAKFAISGSGPSPAA